MFINKHTIPTRVAPAQQGGMDMKDRSIRRHHIERLKKLRSKYNAVPQNDRYIGKLTHTATLCSCYMCGNPRRFWKKAVTMQERRFLAEKED